MTNINSSLINCRVMMAININLVKPLGILFYLTIAVNECHMDLQSLRLALIKNSK